MHNRNYNISQTDLDLFVKIWRYNEPNITDKQLHEVLKYVNDGIRWRLLQPHNYKATISKYKKGITK